ncbi:MAG: TlpA family protein disulfide reductase [Alphaproteobacteria bacterium]
MGADAADPYPPSGYEAYDSPRQLPETSFLDANGNTLSLEDFRGEVVVLNFWATWCGPCQREMPTFNLLQKRLGDSGLEVVAVSLDAKGVPAIEDFFAENEITDLGIYNDPGWDAFKALTTANSGLPYTILLDKKGRALGEVVGPATWHGPSVEEFLSDIIADEEAENRVPSGQLTEAVFLAQSGAQSGGVGGSANLDQSPQEGGEGSTVIYPVPAEHAPVGPSHSRGQCSRRNAFPNI